MEQLSIKSVKDFLQESEIKIELSSTHAKLCYPIINRIYKKMLIGIKFPSIKVEDNLIIDGHHRYLASLLANSILDIAPGIKTSATSGYKWNEVTLDTDDWDTDAKIRMLNEEDARYNNIEINKIAELLK